MNKMGESKIMKKYKGVVFFDYDEIGRAHV